MNKNLEEFIRKDYDILLEDDNLGQMLADFLINFYDFKYNYEGGDVRDEWIHYANTFGENAAILAEKIVKENEEVGLYDR